MGKSNEDEGRQQADLLALACGAILGWTYGLGYK